MKVLIVLLILITGIASAQTVVCPPNAPSNVELAAKEIRRYVYLRTGKLLPIDTTGKGIALKINPSLSAQEYRITSDSITGGSDVGVLYGAYRYAELLGVRFYLDGDVIPDEKLKELPVVKEETGKPLFDTRGIQPFHDFQEGPDWWNQDDYLAYVSQLAKMRMNFIGLHCYPEGGVGPEPLVWIGTTNDIGPKGSVKFSYPSEWANTERRGMWGYASMKTSDFAGGANLLFPADAYAPDVLAGMIPRPKTPEDCNELFNRVGKQMNTVFTAAKQVGVKTCIGTETPLTIPKLVRERSTDARALYTGMFKRIAEVCPVDYYWLWTPERWTWSGNKPEQFAATTRDIQAALDALKDLGNPFTLATSGWVLGPAHDRAALDAFLPKTRPMSCINRKVGHDGVEPAFANIIGRPKWAIPWMENDPNMVGPQPWVARMRHDAVDAHRFGCTGLLGIHWRTKAMAMNVAALAAAAWDQSWVPASYDTKPVKPSKGGEGALGGSIVSFANGMEPVYQTVRYDLKGYNLTVPDGTYTVTLQFVEPHYTAAGKRVFGVKIQGKEVIEHLDVFAKAGQNKALDFSYPDITVTDGTLKIEFTKEVEFPCIAGIVISGKTKATNQLASESFTRKINCGGGKVGDYEADRMSGGTLPVAPKNRAMPVEDFYDDFARANFGDAVAKPAGEILAKIDGVAMPEVSAWGPGPGALASNAAPWSEVKKRLAFGNELKNVRLQVKGAGNLERFDYWLNTCRGAAAMAEVSCLRGQLDKLMAGKKYNEALTTRIELAKAWTRMLTLQTAIVSTPGELGTIANLEHQTRRTKHFIEGHDAALSKAIGQPLPVEVQPEKTYTGPSRIIVPTVRNVVNTGESLNLKIITLPTTQPTVHIRPLGKGDWQKIPATHVARAVYEAKLPAAQDDFEYYITAGETLIWPATAPQLNQTVVITE